MLIRDRMKEMGQKLMPAALMISLLSACGVSNESPREKVAKIVSQIQRADYEGNQVALKKLYDDLNPFLEDKELASRVLYWRGFNMWRRAINGFNDSVDANELEQYLKIALEDFKRAITEDPAFVDAKIGMISCFGLLAFLNAKDQERAREFIGQVLPLVEQVKKAAPDNPRFLWVLGPILWSTPAEHGGGQDKAIENYQNGLELCRKNKLARVDPLEPSWGEPELLMSLAWSNLNKATPDVSAAERDARSALETVPYWHYVRDILLSQILEAKAKAK